MTLPRPGTSKLGWLAIGAFLLAYMLSVVDQFRLELSRLEYRLYEPLASHLITVSQLSNSPNLLNYQVSSLAMKGYQLKRQGVSVQKYQPWFQSAIALAKRSSQLKPMDGEPYRQMVTAYWNIGAGVNTLSHYIARLQAVEPFERNTIFYSLKYYLSFWDKISRAERKQAVSYLFDTQKYGIYYELIGANLADPNLRRKACEIYAFSGKKIEFCIKEFVDLYY